MPDRLVAAIDARSLVLVRRNPEWVVADVGAPPWRRRGWTVNLRGLCTLLARVCAVTESSRRT